MAKGSAPRFDRLVLKLLEVSHAANVDVGLLKELVAQLPAAAVEVRDIQAQIREEGEPCSCGVDAEVYGMIKQMQVLVDNEQNTKKGKTRQKMIEANQRLLAAEVELRREIHGHLVTIHKQSQDLKAAQDALAWSEQLRMETNTSVVAGSVQMTGDLTPSEKLSMAEPSSWTTKGVAIEGEGEYKASDLPVHSSRLTYFAVATQSTPPHRRRLLSRESSGPRDPRLDHPLYRPSTWPYTAVESGTTSFSRTVADKSAPESSLPRFRLGHIRVSLPTASDKRRATEDLAGKDIKRMRFESSDNHSTGGIPIRKPVCQGCRFSGGDCDHGSRCAECDTDISPCKPESAFCSVDIRVTRVPDF